MAVTRCRNCGILNHQTKNCPRYGPWYPEPGKSRADYTALAQEISDKVAQDLMDEHKEHEPDEPGESSGVSDDLGKPCRCGAMVGEGCRTEKGRPAKKTHLSRKT